MDDRKLILELGGPTKVAGMLGLDKTKGGVQRVQNWMTRGIPAKEKLARPDLFLPELTKKASLAVAGSSRDEGDLPPAAEVGGHLVKGHN